MVDELLRRSASSEWRDWEETLDSFGAPGLVDATGLEMDLHSLDQFLLATADDFLEPFADANSAPESPIFAADSGYFYEQDQVDNLHLEKKLKRSQRQQTIQNKEIVAMQSEREINAQAEKLFRRRYDILHGILEAWNTGGIEDLEEIADNVYDDDVTLIGPDYMEGLHGVEAVMSHWTTLLDAFPDGIMEEYTIQCEGGSGEKMTASWVFSGTQIYPIHGVQPRHKKVCINGKSFFSFKGDKIQQVVLSWNYHETLLKLMGVQPDKAHDVMPHTSAFLNPAGVLTPAALAGAVQL
ncbi:hypothetical protein BBJ29_000708 [Phytophthora kernoviae]|uniref:SnoaL-like domain-containing protein n=1 Tax=Phytophthora kernoviae TaxID=325452 RepID=A0A3F2S2I0_9STRA|nr:hypothetical protein BBP00_00000594 [Phytophthora kernoviae]RLN71512.1 hypothetical protein BBJ29_000708 [Phytophthora kernoviae]